MKMMGFFFLQRKLVVVAVTLLLLVVLQDKNVVKAQSIPAGTPPGDDASTPGEPATTTIWEKILEQPELSEFATALELAGLEEALNDARIGPITVFAPKNSAFDSLPQKLWSPEWVLHLQSFLFFHIVPLMRLDVADLLMVAEDSTNNGKGYPTSLVGERIVFTTTPPAGTTGAQDRSVTINNQVHFTPNANQMLEATNGIVHIIDDLLLPAFVSTNIGFALQEYDSLTRFTQLLEETALLGPLHNLGGPGYTVLAPINSAFDKVPINAILQTLEAEGRLDILEYHIMEGVIQAEDLLVEGKVLDTLEGHAKIHVQKDAADGALKLDGLARIDTPNVLVNNGIIHFTDYVLIPVIADDQNQPQPADPPQAPPTGTPPPTPSATVTTPPPTPQTTITGGGNTDATAPPTPTSPPAAGTPPPTPPQTTTTTGTAPPTPTSPPAAGTTSPPTPTPLPTIGTGTSPTTNPPNPPPTPAGQQEPEGNTITEIISSRDELSFLQDVMDVTSYNGIWNGAQPRTVFAATNDAFFDASMQHNIDWTMYMDPTWKFQHLWSLLRYHSVMGKYTTQDWIDNDKGVDDDNILMRLRNFDDENLVISTTTEDDVQDHAEFFKVNGIEFEQVDVEASNGVLHVIEEVLLPSWATMTLADVVMEHPQLLELAALLSGRTTAATDAMDLLANNTGPLTLLAPTQGVMASFLQLYGSSTTTSQIRRDGANNNEDIVKKTDLLKHHLLPGIVYRVAPGEEYTTLDDVSTIVFAASGTIGNQVGSGGTAEMGSNTEDTTTFVYSTPQGETMAIMEVDVIDSNDFILAKNGIIHLIDTWLIPPPSNTNDPFVTTPPAVPTTPAPAPSTSPIPQPTSTVFTQLLDYLETLPVTKEGTFDDPQAPQYRAALWLADEDNSMQPLDFDDPKMLQRYAAATFYYATSGDNWKLCGANSPSCGDTSWLTDVDECTWFSLQCEDGVTIAQIDFPATGNDLIGTLPAEMSLFTGLKHFLAPENFLQGDLDLVFGSLSTLETLAMRNNRLEGVIPTGILESNPNLALIDLGGNQFSGKIPDAIAGVTKLTHLRLSGNLLNGSIPSHIGNLSLLNSIQLQSNELVGSIPEELFSLTKLHTLSIRKNEGITGTINPLISKLTGLGVLELGWTGLGGEIPEEIFVLTDLSEMNLAGADFFGTIPESFRLLNASLMDLFLNDNGFTGSVPEAFNYLTALETLRIQGNHLTGSISEEICAERGLRFQQLATLIVDCVVECDCCDNCEESPSTTPPSPQATPAPIATQPTTSTTSGPSTAPPSKLATPAPTNPQPTPPGVDCTTYKQSVQVTGLPFVLDYVADMTSGTFRGQVTYEGLGWVGFAISPTGKMVGSQAVIGQLAGENKGVKPYSLGGFSVEEVTLLDVSAPPNNVQESFLQNDTHTTMTFAVPIASSNDEAYNIKTNGSINKFLLAAGSSNTLAYHGVRSALEVIVHPCGGPDHHGAFGEALPAAP